MDRTSVFYTECRRFESCWARHIYLLENLCMKFFLEGAFCVDSTNPRKIKVIDVKIRKWFSSFDDINLLKQKIDDSINPLKLSFDDATKMLIQQGDNCDPRRFPSCELSSLL